MKILVFGSLNLDYVYALDHIVLPGETESSSEVKTVPGGKGLNQAIALRKAGAEVYMAGQIGGEGDILTDTLQAAGVDTRFVRKVSGRTGHAIIQLDKNGQNSIILFGGANRSQSREYMDGVLTQFAAGDILLLQNEISELPYLMEKAAERGMYIVLNPSPFDAALKACPLEKISLFLMNEIEGNMLTGETDPEKILAKAAAIYPQAEVILTLGRDGSRYAGSKGQFVQSAFPVKPVDTTAAGDTYTGYFLAGLAEGRPVPEAMRRASFASALACTVHGAAPSIPDPQKVEEGLVRA